MIHSFQSSQRGGTKAKTLLSLVIFIALVYSAIKIVPIYVNNYDLQDAMQQEARFVINPQTGRAKSDDEIRGDVEKKAQELGIPVLDKDVQVLDDSGHIRITMDYTVTVDLIVYQLQLHFHPLADNTSI